MNNQKTSRSALLCLAVIAGFGPGDEVVTAPFTFISSAWGINYVGATPVFAVERFQTRVACAGSGSTARVSSQKRCSRFPATCRR